jgi:hypothetical protein
MHFKIIEYRAPILEGDRLPENPGEMNSLTNDIMSFCSALKEEKIRMPNKIDD